MRIEQGDRIRRELAFGWHTLANVKGHAKTAGIESREWLLSRKT